MSNHNLEKQLIELKEDVEDAKIEKAKIEGQLTNIEKQLKDTYDIDSINEIDIYIEKLNKKKLKREKVIKDSIINLNNTYNLELEY